MTVQVAHRFGLQSALLLLFVAGEVRATPGGGRLFGTDASLGHLLSIDPTTGVSSIRGTIGFQTPALATDPTTGILYAGRGAGLPLLYRINTANGTPTLVGSTGLGFAAISALDFSASGALYASVNVAGDGGTGGDHLAVINKTTGAATVIGSFGTCTGVVIPATGAGSCTIEGMEAIAFDAAGNLFGAKDARVGAAGLYRIDTTTGKATFVAAILSQSAAPPSGGISSLQFACDGTLFGGTARGLPADTGRLVGINRATGVFSFVGAVSSTTGASLGALAFERPCPALDIKPEGTPNSINPKSNGKIPLAILSSPGFNALTDLNVASLRFGRTGNEASIAFCNGGEDVNGDGLLDLVCHAFTQESGFQKGDTTGIVKGLVYGTSPFVATDSVNIVGGGQ